LYYFPKLLEATGLFSVAIIIVSSLLVTKITSVTALDTSGLNCPLPIIKAKKEINTMESGQVLHIISTDPGAVKDFESFANQTGNELLKSEEKDSKFYFLMKKT